MKYIITATASILLMLNVSATTFDIESFGNSLNGWKGKKRIASYSFVDGSYRTHYPTVTRNAGGGIFVSTRIDQGAGSANIVHLELTFSSDGRLMIGQVKGTFAGQKVDSGLITRASDPLPLAEGVASPPSDPLSPADRLAADLFSAFDTAILKNAEKTEEKEDLVSRLFGSKNKVNIAGAVRHNFNLMMARIR